MKPITISIGNKPLPICENSVTLEEESESDITPSESGSYGCTLHDVELSDNWKKFMKWMMTTPAPAPMKCAVAVMNNPQRRKINTWLYELRLKQATSLRKAKKYAKFLGRKPTKGSKMIYFPNAEVVRMADGTLTVQVNTINTPPQC